MKTRITKKEVNNEIKEISRLIENDEINKVEYRSFELAEAIVQEKENADPYFKNECVNIISKIIMKECSKKQIDIDYIISNFEVLSKEVIDVPKKVQEALKVEVLANLKSLK
ncbi:MAG: Phage protein [uncultured Clostridium sp.]